MRSFSVYNHMLIPGHFGDPDAEYEQLIHGVAMWDVAAQRQVELRGPDAGRLAQYLTPRNLSQTRVGQGRYVPLCDYDGWMINIGCLSRTAIFTSGPQLLAANGAGMCACMSQMSRRLRSKGQRPKMSWPDCLANIFAASNISLLQRRIWMAFLWCWPGLGGPNRAVLNFT